MKDLAKEMAITMSGAKGEHVVSRTLEFLERPNTQIFYTVYLTDGTDETELDGVVLTDNGIIILEVKKVKSDFTLTEDGRMVFAGDEYYGKVPLADKMALKRRLLKVCLEKVIREKELNIPVYVDSFIVFSTPKGQRVHLDDRYRREKHCFRTGLNKKIENYLGCAYYKADQLEQLGGILSEMESNVKRFETKLDYAEVRRSLAEAMAVLQDASVETPAVAEPTTYEHHPAPIIELDANRIAQEKKKLERKAAKLGYAVASVFAGVLITGAIAVLGMGNHRV